MDEGKAHNGSLQAVPEVPEFQKGLALQKGWDITAATIAIEAIVAPLPKWLRMMKSEAFDVSPLQDVAKRRCATHRSIETSLAEDEYSHACIEVRILWVAIIWIEGIFERLKKAFHQRMLSQVH